MRNLGLFFNLVKASGVGVVVVVVDIVVTTVSLADSSWSTFSSICFCSTGTSALPLVSASSGMLGAMVVVVVELCLLLDDRFSLGPGLSGRICEFWLENFVLETTFWLEFSRSRMI